MQLESILDTLFLDNKFQNCSGHPWNSIDASYVQSQLDVTAYVPMPNLLAL